MKKQALHHLFSHIPSQETRRVLLRGMRVTDAEDMFDYARRPSVTEYLTWNTHASIEETREYLTYVGQRYRTGDFYDWAMVDKESGRMIGTCGFTCVRCPDDAAEIGYVLNPDFQGRGLATEAVLCLLTFGFERMGLHRIEARFVEGNLPSLRLMERVGMTFEGYARESMRIKGRYCTVGTCGILRHEFLNRR